MCYRTRLGSTLTAIARHGISAFYSRSSSIATSIVSTVQGKDLGGILSASDLEAFRPVLRRPVFGNYKKFRITTTTLPSSGPLMVSMLGIIEAHPLFQNSSTMADGIINGAKFHAIVEAIKFATAQRAILGDRTVELDLDMERMTYILNHIVHPNTARKNSGKISDKSTFPPANYAPDEVSEHLFANVEEEGTCHISALKGQEAVSITTTINSSFGSKIVDAETGIILNNQLADFSFPGQTDSLGYPSNPVNFPKAGRKVSCRLVGRESVNAFFCFVLDFNQESLSLQPMSSMCPTILQDAEGTIIIIGGSGGKRIYSSVFQALIGILEFGMTAEEAVSFPRLYHPLAPNKIDIEPVFRDVYPEVVAGLRQRKHVLNWLGEGQTSPVVASLTQVIVKRSDNSSLVEVGVDPRLYKIGYGQ